MGMHYSHFLLAADPNLAPEPAQVAAFLAELHDLHALPLNATIEVFKHTGQFRTGRNAYTGETLILPIRSRFPIAELASIPQALAPEPDYDLVLTGDGPNPLRLFPIYETDKLAQPFKGSYYLQLRCSLRLTTTSTPELDPLDPNPTDAEFHRLGRVYLFPPTAPRPRFWITFELGKWLHPQMHGEVLIAPAILSAANTAFATTFTEGWTFN
jgi:hypothetical protein